MKKTNIERFDEVTAMILSALYAKFPEPVHIHPELFGIQKGASTPGPFGGMSYGAEWTEMRVFATDTARWLAEEGYLSERPSRHASRYTLSAAGLKSMKHVDQPEIGSDTLGEKLKKASSNGAKATTSKLVDQFLSIGASLITKSVGLD
ncbi:hypothetical protein V0R52_22340 [Pseudomonas asiatica]|uniref:hypothetical protein n=1 Tax=Pseudomonas asiatica TaxID=2219225 RepID=UPI002E7BA075|nr:hypothetical protein [Pseudomonas asiatica]MEE1919133.1 hypothetical protein [Pseudomonas asiatica]